MSTTPGPDQADIDAAAEIDDDAIEPLKTSSGFASAVGGAMLGLEMALRDAPPPQVQAAEHMPERDHVGADGDVVIEFPDAQGPDEPVDPE